MGGGFPGSAVLVHTINLEKWSLTDASNNPTGVHGKHLMWLRFSAFIEHIKSSHPEWVLYKMLDT